jgi:hypothetical protein
MGKRGSFKALHAINLVKASNMADEYVLTHKLIFWKNKRAGSVPNLNYVQNRILLITILINQHQVLGRTNKNSYIPPEILLAFTKLETLSSSIYVLISE